MSKAQLYFLTDQYYIDFPDDKLMKNKDVIDGIPHNRPCFFAFQDTHNANIYWIVPISSKYEKYKKIEQSKIQKYGKCDTIRFGTVLERNTAFLIQNMCPATEKYLIAYIDKNNTPIRIDDRIAEDVSKNARLVLAKAKRGAKVVFPDIFKIYRILEQQLQTEKSILPDVFNNKSSIRENLPNMQQTDNLFDVDVQNHYRRELQKNGFIPSESLLNSCVQLYRQTGKLSSLKDVCTQYKDQDSILSPEERETIKHIGDSCRAQEVQRCPSFSCSQDHCPEM